MLLKTFGEIRKLYDLGIGEFGRERGKTRNFFEFGLVERELILILVFLGDDVFGSNGAGGLVDVVGVGDQLMVKWVGEAMVGFDDAAVFVVDLRRRSVGKTRRPDVVMESD